MAKKGSKFNTYDKELKVKVVKAYLSGEYGSYKMVAEIFGIKNRSQVKTWVKKYRENTSIETFDDKRREGNNPDLGKHFREKNVDHLSLEEQLEYYKLENAVLKKVKALHSMK